MRNKNELNGEIEFMNIQQASLFLCVKPNTLSAWVSRGKIPSWTYVTISTRHKLFIKSKLIEFLLSKKGS